MTIPDRIREALVFQKSGNLRQAAEIYESILEENPNEADARHFLGLAHNQAGRHALAAEMIQKAIELRPDKAGFYANLAHAFFSVGKLKETRDAAEMAIALDRALAPAWILLGEVHRIAGRIDKALDAFKKAEVYSADPCTHAVALNNIGVIAGLRGDSGLARETYQAALKENSECAEAWNNLGEQFYSANDFVEAEYHFRKAVKANNRYLLAHQNLGIVLRDSFRINEALRHFEWALSLSPHIPKLWADAALAYQQADKISVSLRYYRHAVRIAPKFAPAWNNLGSVYDLIGQLEQGIRCTQHALKLADAASPNAKLTYSNILFSFLHTNVYSAAEKFSAHQGYDRLFRKTPPSEAPFIRPPKHDRIRIGYVSPDFRYHVVAMNLAPIYLNHDHSKFEIFSYSNVRRPDPITDSFKSLSDHWRDISGAPDDLVRKQIRSDEIDVLVDLAGHTRDNRLGVFLERSAPVQAHYLGYVHSTGLSTIDWRITDDHGDPIGMTEEFHTEKIWRVPRTCIVYQPFERIPPTVEPPYIRNGFVTFGSFNTLSKITDYVVDTWTAVLANVPQSVLVLKNRAFADPSIQAWFRKRFSRAWPLAGERLRFLPHIEDHYDHLSAYNQIDIALDPFPFNGGVTTFEALTMGVPLIALLGNGFVSRMALRHLSAVGELGWIAKTRFQYVEKAVELASMLPSLPRARRGLRRRLQESCLMDGAAAARELERAFATMLSLS